MLHVVLAMLGIGLAAAVVCCAVVANYLAEWTKLIFFNCILFAVRTGWRYETQGLIGGR